MERARPLASSDRTISNAGDPAASSKGSSAPPGRAARRGYRGAVIGMALGGALLLAGCDSVSGIPGDDPAPAKATTPSAAIPSAPPTTATTSTLAAAPADAPEVGAVPGVPEAATALRRWAADLESDTIAELQDKCWTMAPGNVADMYEDKQTILAAIAQPGAATASTVTWKSRSATVTVERDAIATGYACPRVFPAGTEVGYNDADARHTVRRYLARFVGEPLDPADKEGNYPLICKASPAEWDPTGTGSPTPPPLANNPGKLTGATDFAGQEISSEFIGDGYLTVEVPVTNSSGVTQVRTFTLTESDEGYCIGDVSP
ncbi:hypothetical protein [Nocardia sp. NPDC050793]|uniref:hypothetical protein n=1 Tax=Nocardia sp. NPDC050793 TaxID=3155159 RepID=UPI0033CE0C44